MIKYQDVVQDRSGNAVAGAEVRVYLTGTQTLATISATDGGAAIVGSVVVSDSDGDFAFFVASGTYDLTVSVVGYDTVTRSVILIGSLGSGGPTWTNPLEGGYETADELSFAYTNFSESPYFNGGIEIPTGQSNIYDDFLFFKGMHEATLAAAALDIATDSAALHTKTLSAPSTLTFSTRSLTGAVLISFSLQITNSGGAQTITWPASVVWPSPGTVPTPTAGVDVYTFYTIDDGVTWRGALVASYAS